MAEQTFFATLASTVLGIRGNNPVARMMAGFTGLAVAVTLILATVLPVEARRGTACAAPLEAPAASCTTD